METIGSFKITRKWIHGETVGQAGLLGHQIEEKRLI
jgi:hypothetical protein